MARPRYRDPAYIAAIARWKRIIARRSTDCTADLCLFGDRTIPAGAPRETWDMGHDRTTGAIRGPEHARCNRHEGAVYGNLTRRYPQRNPPRRRTCTVCGQPYRATYGGQKTCGRTCGAELQRRNRPSPRTTPSPALPPRTCWCGATFTPRSAKQQTCGGPCSDLGHRYRHDPEFRARHLATVKRRQQAKRIAVNTW